MVLMLAAPFDLGYFPLMLRWILMTVAGYLVALSAAMLFPHPVLFWSGATAFLVGTFGFGWSLKGAASKDLWWEKKQ